MEPSTIHQNYITMFLLDLFAAKVAFIAMVVSLIVIPAWILLVAFTKKKGKADSIDAPEEEPTAEEAPTAEKDPAEMA